MKAKEIMTKKVITVKSSASVRDIARIFHRKKISGIPVVDKDNNLQGIVSETDLVLKASGPHLPPHIQILGGIIYLESPHVMEEELKKVMAINAADIMTKDVVTVEPEEDVGKIATLMLEEEINRIPVIKDGKLVGIITRHDILKTMM